jgi:putative ABC transport system permease protein
MYWGADLRAEQFRIFDQVFVFMYVVLAVLIIPSLLGLINTLAINVLERTREIGVLRAIGATRTQIRRMVVAEAVLLSMLGAALGILGGLALGYGLTAAMAGSFGSGITYSFPLAGMLCAVAVALLMAVLASLLPARQAARMRIVSALQYE